MKNRFVIIGLFIVLFLGLWNLFDYLYSTLITHSEYQFSVVSDLILPLVISVIMGCLLFLTKKRSDDSE